MTGGNHRSHWAISPAAYAVRLAGSVRLRAVLGNLDTRNITLVADAITAANG